MDQSAPKQSLLQKLFGYVGFLLGIILLSLMVAEPIVEYAYGKGKLSSLVSTLIGNTFLGLLVFVGLALLLGWAGVLPRIPLQRLHGTAYGISGRGLILGIGVAFFGAFVLLAVVLFYPPFVSDKHLTDLVINIGPMFLLIGVWIAIMAGMRWDRRRKRDSQTDD